MLPAAPMIVPTEVFARVPDRLRMGGRRSPWAETHRPGAATDCFLEGPAFDIHGTLYLVDVAWGRIFRVDPQGRFDLCAEYDGNPNGLAIHRDGRILIADFSRGILLLDPQGGGVTPLVEGHRGRPFHGVNDLVFAENGDLYFTDQGLSGLHDPFGRLFRLRADGELQTVLERIPSPNGLAIDPAGRTLFLAVTRDNAVWRVPLSPEGEAYKVGAFIRLSGGIGPDGMALDAEGGLAVAHIGLGVVWHFDAQGEPRARIASCAGRATTNVAFGGADRRTLFITESETGQVLTARMPVPGLTPFSHS